MLIKRYILNNAVIFEPETRFFISVDNASLRVPLSESAARCLDALLRSRELLSQDALYDYGWQGSSVIPSPNTLYQTISILRRAYKQIDSNGVNLILTETRKGFRLNPAVKIEENTFEIRERFYETDDPENDTPLVQEDETVCASETRESTENITAEKEKISGEIQNPPSEKRRSSVFRRHPRALTVFFFNCCRHVSFT